MLQLEKALELAIEQALRDRGEHTGILIERVSFEEENLETMGAGPEKSGRGRLTIECKTFNPSGRR